MTEVLTPCVQDGEEADLNADMLWVGRDGLQSLGGRGKGSVIDYRLVLLRDESDRFRQCEDDVKVKAIEKLALALLDPRGSGERLALRAKAGCVNYISDALGMTGIALPDMAAERSGTARGDRPHDKPLRSRR